LSAAEALSSKDLGPRAAAGAAIEQPSLLLALVKRARYDPGE
jgi:hypothetical protein